MNTFPFESEFVRDFNKYTVKELRKRFGLSEGQYNMLRRKHKLRKNKIRVLKKKINTFEQECNVCKWYLTGDEVFKIARIYECGTDEIEDALKNRMAFATAYNRLLLYSGKDAIKRTKREIERWVKDEQNQLNRRRTKSS